MTSYNRFTSYDVCLYYKALEYDFLSRNSDFRLSGIVISYRRTGDGKCPGILTALKSGVDPVAIKETVYQATAYLGIGRVYDFLVATNRIMEKCGVTLPLAQQSTTTEESRFQAGLDKQVALFGPGMKKQQTDAPALRRNINRWLADNCFGDYYTRTGLNDQEREMFLRLAEKMFHNLEE